MTSEAHSRRSGQSGGRSRSSTRSLAERGTCCRSRPTSRRSSPQRSGASALASAGRRRPATGVCAATATSEITMSCRGGSRADPAPTARRHRRDRPRLLTRERRGSSFGHHPFWLGRALGGSYALRAGRAGNARRRRCGTTRAGFGERRRYCHTACVARPAAGSRPWSRRARHRRPQVGRLDSARAGTSTPQSNPNAVVRRSPLFRTGVRSLN
jgi:hypothetical protein